MTYRRGEPLEAHVGNPQASRNAKTVERFLSFPVGSGSLQLPSEHLRAFERRAGVRGSGVFRVKKVPPGSGSHAPDPSRHQVSRALVAELLGAISHVPSYSASIRSLTFRVRFF